MTKNDIGGDKSTKPREKAEPLETTAQIEPLRKPVDCPSCSKKSSREHYPFCSSRCRDVDLHKWFSGNYVIASAEENDFDE